MDHYSTNVSTQHGGMTVTPRITFGGGALAKNAHHGSTDRGNRNNLNFL